MTIKSIKYAPIVFIALLTALLSSGIMAENMYDANSGNLVISEIRVNDELAYTATFTLVSNDPLVWAVESFEETLVTTRTAARYEESAGLIHVPEITVQGELYNLSFVITNNCQASVCLEPELDSLESAGRTGADIFTTTVSSASTFSCASCHAISEENGFASDGLRRPGHPLQNASRRPSFKNTELDSMLDAVNICLNEWMNTASWTETDTDWINLLNWIDDMADETTAEPVLIEIVTAANSVAGGDAEAGRDLFNTSCIVCHGQDGEGTALAPKISERGLQADYIQRRVRTSGLSNSAVYENLTGGVMPFWGADRLSNGELADIVAFLATDDVELLPTGGGGMSGPSNCGSSSAKIGQTMSFSQKFHDVSGTATIIDDCTIELSNFNFDGGGIDVQIYAGSNLQFQPNQGGFSLLGGLLGTRYTNATLTITIPEGVSLNDFDSLSVWCVPVGVSFGDGQFS
ncbi:MAG: hypothetical protein COA96_14800 [SAR86 cluster bacterium]|uniref:Cytochrome c domain-containing protein n=1 Tax=SAR86 cluster bacterium TaxID=2030880 RepID=A0A2A5AU00_9GAMM|nr:MAG: hypothetical protein COA96_14800 [SAR86 cluster bacterium]